jgi:hypothetical protein
MFFNPEPCLLSDYAVIAPVFVVIQHKPPTLIFFNPPAVIVRSMAVCVRVLEFSQGVIDGINWYICHSRKCFGIASHIPVLILDC